MAFRNFPFFPLHFSCQNQRDNDPDAIIGNVLTGTNVLDDLCKLCWKELKPATKTRCDVAEGIPSFWVAFEDTIIAANLINIATFSEVLMLRKFFESRSKFTNLPVHR
jgi:hypothetical protein